MHLNMITERILADAGAEAERIETDAKKEGDRIVADAKKDGAGLLDVAVRQAERRGEQLKKQGLAVAQIAARDMVIAAKQELIDQVFTRARARLMALGDGEYVEVAAGLIAKSASGGEEVIFDPADREMAPKIIDRANADLKANDRLEVKLSPEARPIGKGFILHWAGVEENHAFDRLIADARERLEGDVASLVFGERR